MGTEHGLPQSFASYRNAVTIELRKIVDSCPAALANILRYHMGWQDEYGHRCRRESGKLIRSSICLLSCRVVGGNTSQAMPAAAAIELVHNFSLIHDDVEDASDERHHRPTVWKLWGQSQAINTGDAMLALAYLALAGLKKTGIADKKIVECTKVLTRACLELCEGQYLDIEYEDRLDITVDDYVEMAAGKTAALFAAATSLGAYLGSEDTQLVDSFRSFGRELGMVFQIHDDILGIWGGRETVGKSADDICQRKKTLPVAFGLQNGRGESGERLRMLYSGESIAVEDIKGVTRILDDLGARERAENMAKQYYRKALAHLDATGLAPSNLTPLRETAGFLLTRDF
jgi:geranylgeranyl diphosphate synthase type I